MKKKILVFEKDPFILDLITLVLTDAGYAVNHCNTENAFFGCIDDYDPDAILLDIIRPTVIGTKLCEDIKNHPAHSKIPVIVLSTHPNIEITKKFCAEEVINKPFDIDTLLNVVEKQLAA